MGVDSRGRLVGELIAARTATLAWGASSIDHIVVGDALPAAFATSLPAAFRGEIRAWVGDCELLGSGLVWPIDFGPVGWVVLEDRQLCGEVHLDWNGDASLTLVLTSGRSATSFDIPPVMGSAAGRSFSRRLNDIDVDDAEVHVSVRLPDGRLQPLLGSPVRIAQSAPTPPSAVPPSMRVRRQPRDLTRKVNIVLPIMSGIRAALPCLRTVLATTSRHRALVTVVDHASSATEIHAVVRALGRHGARLEVLRPSRTPLPGAVNRGLQQHPELDAVLLDANTEMCTGWLQRLCAAAYSKPDIGSVIPLTEAARLADHADAPFREPSMEEVSRLDLIARVVNARLLIEVPVATLACVYLKRQCLKEVGTLGDPSIDAGRWQMLDFFLRAAAQGWRHVAHAGIVTTRRAVPAQGPAELLKDRRNSRVLNYRHPGYGSLLAAFRRDPSLRAALRVIDEKRLIADARSPLLLVGLAHSDGIPKHIDARIVSARDSGRMVLWLCAAPNAGRQDPGQVRLVAPNCAHLTYALPQERRELTALLRTVNPTRVEIHDRSGLDGTILKIVMSLGVPYSVVIHDHGWLCPRRHFLTGAGEYCREPPVTACEHCVDRYGASIPLGGSVANWLRRSAAMLTGAERVLVPSHDAGARLRRHMPGITPIVEPWAGPIAALAIVRRRGAGRLRVLLLGEIDPRRGFAVLRECARDAARRDLSLEFVVVGSTCDDATLIDTGRVFVTGPHRADEAAMLIAREGGDVVLFPGITPEVWCEPLTLAFALRVPVVAFDVGAVAERLRQAGTGVLLTLGTPAALVNDALLRSPAVWAPAGKTGADGAD
jgi:glycosyltransferase involved in cell wall biosynthesis